MTQSEIGTLRKLRESIQDRLYKAQAKRESLPLANGMDADRAYENGKMFACNQIACEIDALIKEGAKK